MEPNKKNFASLFEQLNGVPFNPQFPEPEPDLLTDEMDHWILMHRDAHFGGNFDTMLAYYEQESHIGIDPHLDLDRIHYLKAVEHELGGNLAALFLDSGEAEQVALCRRAYEKLRDVYDYPAPSAARYIADLILSEEEEPEIEIQAIVEQGPTIVPLLIDLLQSDAAYSPLYPGYGYAPYLAACCLGDLGDSRALIPLFQMLHREMVFSEEIVLESLYKLGAPAKQFLMQRLQGRPITFDHRHAAFALSSFAEDDEISKLALTQLEDPLIHQDPLLGAYLLSLCSVRNTLEVKEQLMVLQQAPTLPKELSLQIHHLVQDWH